MHSLHTSMMFGNLWVICLVSYVLLTTAILTGLPRYLSTNVFPRIPLNGDTAETRRWLVVNIAALTVLAILPYVNLVAFMLTSASLVLGLLEERRLRQLRKAYLDRVLSEVHGHG